MFKAKLTQMLAAKEARKQEITTKSKASTDIAELRSLNAELEGLNGEITELRSVIDNIPDEAPGNGQPEQRTGTPVGGFNPIGTYGIGGNADSQADEKRGIDAIFAMPTSTAEEKAEMRTALFAAPEYRTGYLKALSGRNDLSDVEKRALTAASNSGGAAVPTTTYGMIIKRMEQTSALFGLINKSYIPGNVVLPVANPQTAALWTDTAPGTDADDTLSQVALNAYALSKFAKVKGQLLIMAIDAFESYIVNAISDQLAIAVENAILNGTGTNQPTGILTGVTWGTGNSGTWDGSLGYDDMVGAKSMLGLYRSNAVWVVNATMEAMIYKIKTTVNQPLFTQNPITGLIANPLGFPVVVDYYMPDDTLLLMNPDYYFMNINQNPTINSDDSAGYLSTSRVYRGTMYADGKPALSDAFIKLTKAEG